MDEQLKKSIIFLRYFNQNPDHDSKIRLSYNAIARVLRIKVAIVRQIVLDF